MSQVEVTKQLSYCLASLMMGSEVTNKWITSVTCGVVPEPSLWSIRVWKMGAEEHLLLSTVLLGNSKPDGCCFAFTAVVAEYYRAKVSKQQPQNQFRFLFNSCVAEEVQTSSGYLLFCLEKALGLAWNSSGLSVASLSNTNSRANRAAQLIQYCSAWCGCYAYQHNSQGKSFAYNTYANTHALMEFST